jgi:hypothetical protein
MVEYLDNNNKISVNNLLLNNTRSPIYLADIRTLTGTIEKTSFYDAIALIEFGLFEIVDYLCKAALKTYVGNYFICGGKAISDLISPTIKSFDFDIHVRDDYQIEEISKHITLSIKTMLNLPYKKIIRKQIFSLLKNMNFVDDTLEAYYETDDLFYFGRRVVMRMNGTVKGEINGIFIKLKFINNIIIHNNIKTNYTNYYPNGTYDDSFSDNQSIIYIPIADIDIDNQLIFGIRVFDSPNLIYKDNISTISYAPFSILVYNLLKLLTVANKKLLNNLNKITLINNPLIYNCDFISDYTLDNFIMEFTKIKSQLEPFELNILYDGIADAKIKTIIDNNILFIKNDSTFLNIINNIINKILTYKNCKLLTCVNINSDSDNNIFVDGMNQEAQKQYSYALELLLYNLDKDDDNYYILQYTQTLFRSLNTYCCYINNNINILPDLSYHSRATDKEIILSNRTNIMCSIKEMNIINDFNDVCNRIDSIYDNIHTNAIYKQHIKDEFTVYSLNEIINFNKMECRLSFLNLSYVKTGDYIMIDQYLSTTFNNNFDFEPFYTTKTNPVLLKINIKKNNNRWLFINKYSFVQTESEILIKRNSVFIITNIGYINIRIRRRIKSIKLVTLELSDFDMNDRGGLNERLKISTKINGMNKYDNILKSSLCIKTLHYVYDTLFTRPYQDSLICRDLDIESSMTVNVIHIDGTRNDYTIQRPNHSLNHVVRVVCWIQLVCYQIIKYQNTSPHYVFVNNHEFIMKTCIASIFMITGRESEASFSTPINRTTCDRLAAGHPYTRYFKASSENFKTYIEANRITFSLFTDEDIINYAYCLQYYYYIQNNNTHDDLGTAIRSSDILKCISHIFTIAHNYDLVRCFPKVKVYLPISHDHALFNYEKHNHIQLLTNLLLITGDRVINDNIDIYDVDKNFNDTNLHRYSDYDKREFYLCSTNVEYCIERVLNVSSQYFNQIINDIKELDCNIADNVTDFNLATIPMPLLPFPPPPPPPPPLQRGGAINYYSIDDNIINIDDINQQIINSNIGITIFCSHNFYINNTDYFNKGIYLQNNIILLKNKNYIDDEFEVNIHNTNRVILSENKQYPLYYLKNIINYRIKGMPIPSVRRSSTQSDKVLLSKNKQQTVLPKKSKELPFVEHLSKNPASEATENGSDKIYYQKYLKYKHKYLTYKLLNKL